MYHVHANLIYYEKPPPTLLDRSAVQRARWYHREHHLAQGIFVCEAILRPWVRFGLSSCLLFFYSYTLCVYVVSRVGRLFHTYPNVLHYTNSDRSGIMEVGSGLVLHSIARDPSEL